MSRLSPWRRLSERAWFEKEKVEFVDSKEGKLRIDWAMLKIGYCLLSENLSDWR